MKSSWIYSDRVIHISQVSTDLGNRSMYPIGFILGNNNQADRLEYLFPDNHAEVYAEIRLACTEYPEYLI